MRNIIVFSLIGRFKNTPFLFMQVHFTKIANKFLHIYATESCIDVVEKICLHDKINLYYYFQFTAAL